MKTRFYTLLLLFPAIACASEVPDLVFVNKKAFYLQTGPQAPSLAYHNFHSAIEGIMNPMPVAPTLSLPAGAPQATFVYDYDPGDERYDLQRNFTPGGTSSLAQLDGAFPNGNYTFHLSGESLTLSLTGNSYPSVPFITSSAGSWVGGKLVLTASEAAAGFTLTGSATNANGYRTLEIYDDADVVDYFHVENEFGGTTVSPLTGHVPGGMLVPGGHYYGNVEYDEVVDSDSTKFAEFGTGFAMYSTATEFEILVVDEPGDIVGTWMVATDGGVAYVSFLDDGTYHLTQDGLADESGFPGMESGSYTWDPATGAFSTVPVVDQNGEWGLSHNSPSPIVRIVGDTFELIEDEDVATLTRLAPTPGSIVGTWVVISQGRTAVVIFNADGTYRHSEAGESEGGGSTGMEIGTYTWDPETGALAASPILDQNGEWGLSHPLAPFVFTTTGDQMILLEGPLTFVFQRAESTTALSAFLSDADIPYNQRGPLDDPDGDGVVNLLEYAFGLDPAGGFVAGGLPAVDVAQDGGDPFLEIVYRRRIGSQDLTYAVEVSSNLTTWQSEHDNPALVEEQSAVANGDGTETVTARVLEPIDEATSKMVRIAVTEN